jgi:hypothetical protein
MARLSAATLVALHDWLLPTLFSCQVQELMIACTYYMLHKLLHSQQLLAALTRHGYGAVGVLPLLRRSGNMQIGCLMQQQWGCSHHTNICGCHAGIRAWLAT